MAPARPSSLQRFISLSSDLATSRRLWPRSASLRANASPIPEEAPVMRVVFIPYLAPSGATENSPAIYRWDKLPKEQRVPQGRKNSFERPLLVLDTVLIEKGNQFFFEGLHFVMLFL